MENVPETRCSPPSEGIPELPERGYVAVERPSDSKERVEASSGRQMLVRQASLPCESVYTGRGAPGGLLFKMREVTL